MRGELPGSIRRPSKAFRALVGGLALLALASASPALEPSKAITQYPRDAWTIEDGLPQSTVQAILQARRGDLWIGTQGGLVRFDGMDFEVFDRSNTLAITTGGDLWVGTRGELSRLADGGFETFTTADGLPSDIVGALHAGSGGTLWAGTAAGLSRLRDGVFTQFTTDDGLPHDVVWAVTEDLDDNVWVGTQGGLSRLTDGRITSAAGAQGLPGGADLAGPEQLLVPIALDLRMLGAELCGDPRPQVLEHVAPVGALFDMLQPPDQAVTGIGEGDEVVVIDPIGDLLEGRTDARLGRLLGGQQQAIGCRKIETLPEHVVDQAGVSAGAPEVGRAGVWILVDADDQSVALTHHLLLS